MANGTPASYPTPSYSTSSVWATLKSYWWVIALIAAAVALFWIF